MVLFWKLCVCVQKCHLKTCECQSSTYWNTYVTRDKLEKKRSKINSDGRIYSMWIHPKQTRNPAIKSPRPQNLRRCDSYSLTCLLPTNVTVYCHCLQFFTAVPGLAYRYFFKMFKVLWLDILILCKYGLLFLIENISK